MESPPQSHTIENTIAETKASPDHQRARNEQGSGRDAVLVLGFFGASENHVRRRYRFLQQDFHRDMVVITCPAPFILLENLTARRLRTAVKRLDDRGIASRVSTLVVASGGGAALFFHLLSLCSAGRNPLPGLRRIIWENSPSCFTPEVLYQSVLGSLKRRDSLLMRMTLFPPLWLSAKAETCFRSYARRVDRMLRSSKLPFHPPPEEHCIAVRHDPVVPFAYVRDWQRSVDGKGRRVRLHVFDGNRHLCAHRHDPQTYQSLWRALLRGSTTSTHSSCRLPVAHALTDN